jgi:Ser/Thr protein kinase RdoA (MazF antagonist)
VLDPSHAGRIAERFGLGDRARLVGPVASGRLGDVWRLTTDHGRFAVKDARFADAHGDAERDAAYQDLVRDAGVPMPSVVRTVDGRVTADVAGRRIRVYEWVDVLPSDRHLDPEAVGRLLAAIHSVEVAAEDPVDGWYVDPVGADAWHELLGRLRIRDCPFADRLAALLPTVLELEEVIAAPKRVQVCHRDLWADNVLRTPEGGLVVLDWENSGPGDVAGELGCALFEWGLGDRGRSRALYTAYVDAGGPGRLEGREDFTMLVAQTGNIARVACERWLTSSTEEERADNAAWAAEFFDDPVTPGVLDRILRTTNS